MDYNTLRNKILKGLEISFQRLVVQKSKEDQELVFCKDGRIIRIKAKELLKKSTIENNETS